MDLKRFLYKVLVDLSFSAYWRFIEQRQGREKGVFTMNYFNEIKTNFNNNKNERKKFGESWRESVQLVSSPSSISLMFYY